MRVASTACRSRSRSRSTACRSSMADVHSWVVCPPPQWRGCEPRLDQRSCLFFQIHIGDKFLWWCKIPPSAGCTLSPWWSFSSPLPILRRSILATPFSMPGPPIRRPIRRHNFTLIPPQRHCWAAWWQQRVAWEQQMQLEIYWSAKSCCHPWIGWEKVLISWLLGVHSFQTDNGAWSSPWSFLSRKWEHKYRLT